jgi:hypothetical protein
MDQDRSDIEDAIGRDREQLASTLEALERKADVKARLHEKVDDARARVKRTTPQAAYNVVVERPAPFVAVLIFTIGLLVGRAMGRHAS